MHTSSDSTYPRHEVQAQVLNEGVIEDAFIQKLRDLKYTIRPDITDRASLEQNFREKFEALNRVRLTDAEFARLLDEIVTQDVFTASKTLRSINSFTRDDGTPLNYSLVNLKDWCKNHFEVINQLRINTDNSHHRYDVLILINGVPCVQIELKTLGVNPRRAMEQIVEYKNDPGNGYTKTLLCFMQIFIVSNRDRTYYFANNNARHFAFNAEERFLPIYEFADEDNTKITHLDPFAERFLKKCDLGGMVAGNERDFVKVATVMITDDGRREIVTHCVRRQGYDQLTSLDAPYFRQAIDYLIDNHDQLKASGSREPIRIERGMA
jgi:type I restriction enzyme R subunit